MATVTSTRYTEGFKESILQKYFRSDLNFKEFCVQEDLPYSTAYGWKRKYDKSSLMRNRAKNKKQSQPIIVVTSGESLKAQSLSPQEKLQVIASTLTMTEEELGDFLRSKGLLSTDLESWKNEFYSSQQKKKCGRPKLDPEVVKLRQREKDLERNLKRKDKALAEMSARVVLLKKSHEIWGLPEDEE